MKRYNEMDNITLKRLTDKEVLSTICQTFTTKEEQEYKDNISLQLIYVLHNKCIAKYKVIIIMDYSE